MLEKQNGFFIPCLHSVKSRDISKKHSRLWDWYFKKEMWTLWTEDWLSTYIYIPKCSAQNLSGCSLLFKNAITKQREKNMWKCSLSGFIVFCKRQLSYCSHFKMDRTGTQEKLWVVSHQMAGSFKWVPVPYHIVQVSSPDVCMDPIHIRGQIQRYQKALSAPEWLYVSSRTLCLQHILPFLDRAYAYRLSKYTWSND